MKRTLFIALALATPAIGQAPDVPLTIEEHDALQAYLACLYNQTRDADDGVMDAKTLIHSVAPKCRSLLGAAADVFTRGQSKADRETLYSGWLTLEDEQGQRTVVAERQDRQNSAATSTSVVTDPPPSPKRIALKATPKRAIAATPAGEPMSAWRRAYIAKHHHEPPK